MVLDKRSLMSSVRITGGGRICWARSRFWLRVRVSGCEWWAQWWTVPGVFCVSKMRMAFGSSARVWAWRDSPLNVD